MSKEMYRPERDITPTYLSTVQDWIEATGEVLVIMRYLHGGGSKDFALITSAEKFKRLIYVCPVGTDIIVFRDMMLPIRGIVDDTFIKQVRASLSEVSEYLFVNIKPEKSGDPRCFGEFDYIRHLENDLQDMVGETIAIGECPDFTGPDNETMISASKGGIDGAR